MRLIFLDFDGVLHPCEASVWPEDSDEYTVDGDMLFCRLPLLVEVLRDQPDVRLVVSSSWRRLYDRVLLRNYLGEELKARYLGETPALFRETRYDEVLEFLRRRNLKHAPWVVLEDDPRNFPKDAPVIWCRSEIGLDEATTQQLREWLEATR